MEKLLEQRDKCVIMMVIFSSIVILSTYPLFCWIYFLSSGELILLMQTPAALKLPLYLCCLILVDVWLFTCVFFLIFFRCLQAISDYWYMGTHITQQLHVLQKDQEKKFQ